MAIGCHTPKIAGVALALHIQSARSVRRAGKDCRGGLPLPELRAR